MPQITAIANETARLIEVFVQDTSRVDGAGLPGLTYASGGLIASYYRDDTGAWVTITLAAMTFGTWVSGGFVEQDATRAPGWYQLGLPNAALASGAKVVLVHLEGAVDMAPVPLLIELAPGIAAAVVVRG